MRKVRYNVITFPGSNCDNDAAWVINLQDAECEFVWHKDSELKNPDVVVLPGGFSYGDYLRCGAIAKFSNIMNQVIKFANSGGIVIGICNGFQILTESGLLPGALLMNHNLQFICQHQYVKVENVDTPFTNMFKVGDVIDIPIAHKEGNYYIDELGLKKLTDNGQIVFKYCDRQSDVNDGTNPNGSLLNIAGIINDSGNVLGMMPHPERAAEGILLSDQGVLVFQSINKWVSSKI